MTPSKEAVIVLCLFVNFLTRLSKDEAVVRIVIAGSKLVIHFYREEKIKEAEEVLLDMYDLLHSSFEREGVREEQITAFLAHKDIQTEFHSAVANLGISLGSVTQEFLEHLLKANRIPTVGSSTIPEVKQA